MRFDPAGWPFVFVALLLAAAMRLVGVPYLDLVLAAVAVFLLFFFRDPERQPPEGDDEHVLAPADGRVLVAGDGIADTTPPGTWQQISIFLSPLDVHVNRIPVSGRVTRVTFTRGAFLPAYRQDAGTANERSEIWIDHAGQTIVARQIVGVLARRVVCRVETGAQVRAGDRFGIMKFGSRMDVFLPPSADIRVHVGELVRAGETVIAVLH